ncbi:Mitochondrial translocator assembly and maintenance protein 41 [Malassezia sp. CBS 17886]|nr:Mitochondrial translocator assembly and maintenance protein 41 [Malassezia sp. CBS 17886]
MQRLQVGGTARLVRAAFAPNVLPSSLIRHARADHTSAPPRSTSTYPASFVVPELVPSVSELVDAEAKHRHGLLRVLESVHLPPFLYAFAYGSGVFSQEAGQRGRSMKRAATAVGSADAKAAHATPVPGEVIAADAGRADDAKHPPDDTDAGGPPSSVPPMVDMVVAVQNPVHWHAANMMRNPGHYPWWARWGGMWMLRRVQDMGAGVWYVPYVRVGNRVIKYGVVGIDRLCHELIEWDDLYLSGRMHKPIATLFDATDGRVALDEQANLASALRVSFLLLPRAFSERDLYMTMASLSYLGDFRMRVPGGENQRKVQNIVDNQAAWFRIRCSDLVIRFPSVHVHPEGDLPWLAIKQDDDARVRARYAASLPRALCGRIAQHYLSQPQFRAALAHAQGTPAGADPQDMRAGAHTLDFWLVVVTQPDFKNVLRDAIAQTVDGPARTQSLKGLYTAGILHSLQYLWAKMGKT